MVMIVSENRRLLNESRWYKMLNQVGIVNINGYTDLDCYNGNDFREETMMEHISKSIMENDNIVSSDYFRL